MMAALEARAWHVLTQLVRGRNSPAQREKLFPLVMEQEQWSVVRVLMERGVSVELRLGAIPIFLKHHQWLMAARVTEHDVTDSVIRHVMRQALEHGEGSLVAHCIGSLKEPLSVIERQTIFQQALSKGLWWAVKRLVEERDDEGKTERDEALQTAAEYNQWSVVTHCLQHGADIDKKDEEGNTLLHRWARRGDWTGVVQLVEQGADQNIPDSEGYIVLHRVMKHTKLPLRVPNPVKLLIEFHGDINRPYPEGNTAWEYLVAKNDAHVINTTLMWSQVDTKKVDKTGNTALHTLCAAGMVDAVRSLVARGNSPLTVNNEGMTALCSAANHCDHKIVLECIKLGVGTFQSRFTDASRIIRIGLLELTPCCVQQYELASPFQTAAVEGDLPLMEALYQAGACSNAELHRFSTALKARNISRRSNKLMKAKEMCDYVETLACNPRSLKSACRLAICHQLGVRRDRERRVGQLDRLDDRERHQQLDTHMVHYLLFSDLEQGSPYPSLHQPDEPESDEVKIAKVLSILGTGKIGVAGKLLDFYWHKCMPEK
ncbi:ankyrin repeat and death domain-containing protein 1B-like isoform X2 [Littorina saxatilis]|uniref:Ankyrin repeat protein n=1 Tax=Littorina saxatilis TaxID=31220 RepID=A0AAN9APS8_9CAEN